MMDIAMCLNKACPSFKGCHRAQAEPSEYRQAYASFEFDTESGRCAFFWQKKEPIKNKRKIAK